MPDLKIFSNIGYLDILDIIVVAVFFYYIMATIKGTRAVQILQGIVALFVLSAFAYLAKMHTLLFLLKGLLMSMAFAIPVVFQPELRRGLMRLGQKGILTASVAGKLERADLNRLVDEVSFACFNLSLERFGALIVIERGAGLQEIIETGQLVNGVISAKLIQTIFRPKTPLHDGAVVIQGDQITAAACYLPLTESTIDARFGTRHRAAIGISEQSDAVVVVVSEETGDIRVAFEGRFSKPLNEINHLKAYLNRVLQSDASSVIRHAGAGTVDGISAVSAEPGASAGPVSQGKE